MKRILLVGLVSLCFIYNGEAQLYYPPISSEVWDTISLEQMGWCEERVDDLYGFLSDNNTKAFILLKDDKIVLEQYFNDHSQDENWYWASAGKSLTAFAIGIAQEKGYLQINDRTSEYLGTGWTSCSEEKEDNITIHHQLTMTTGLDDDFGDIYCTDKECLQCLDINESRWAYHNGPYTLLTNVIEEASNQNINGFISNNISGLTGINGLYVYLEYNRIFFSTARSMARFGLLALGKGRWQNNWVLNDSIYYNNMISPSQDINEAYGYLWWLNGKQSFMIPRSQVMFNGSISPNAPNDMIAAMGMNGQFINVVPSQNLVWIRMGEAPEDTLVPYTFNDEIWQKINELMCNPSNTLDYKQRNDKIKIYPNPFTKGIHITNDSREKKFTNYTLLDVFGRVVSLGLFVGENQYVKLDENLNKGVYYVALEGSNDRLVIPIFKN